MCIYLHAQCTCRWMFTPYIHVRVILMIITARCYSNGGCVHVYMCMHSQSRACFHVNVGGLQIDNQGFRGVYIANKVVEY